MSDSAHYNKSYFLSNDHQFLYDPLTFCDNLEKLYLSPKAPCSQDSKQRSPFLHQIENYFFCCLKVERVATCDAKMLFSN